MISQKETAETRLWRTLFHVIYIHDVDGVWVRVPGFDSNIAVRVQWYQISPEIRDQIKLDHYYHGLAAIGAETYEGLNIYINEAPHHELTKEELDQDGLG